MHAFTDDQRRWFKRFGQRDAGRIRLLCFHCAGGNAMTFRDWHRFLPACIEPVAVQLPGRLDRFSETPYDCMEPLIHKLAEVMKPFLDQPFAFYGASMGARVAWRLAHLLRDHAMPMPRALYVASNVAPSVASSGEEWGHSDDRLIQYVRELGGTPQVFLDEADLRSRLLSVLRADLTVLATDTFRARSPLEVPVRAFAGREDAESPPEHMSPWQDETCAGFGMDVVPGGHFFSPIGQRQVMRVISDGLGDAGA